MRPLLMLVWCGLALAACGGTAQRGSASNSQAVSPGDTCSEPGSEAPSTDGCNTCGCSDGEWSCTKKACLDAGACEDGATRAAADGCNTCSCSDGEWLCTEIGCVDAGGGCTKGDTMDDGCNTCSCIANGSWVCTASACNPDEPVACGGFAFNTCTENEYCAYVEGQLCGQADASSTCEPRPQACDLVYLPVCGCDGMTYGNDCEAAAAGTGVYQSGECETLD